ncbi:MAG: SDR family oxidoreductase [Firmicutes bacterium]|nr:SDR family oxidoreductase [Bacillota bacterium]
MKLQGKVALITGGATGIGAATVRRFVKNGAKVCIVGRREEYLDKIIETLPSGTAVKCPGDVSSPEDIKRMVETVIKFGGRLDILVNNAAYSVLGGVTDIDLDDWHRSIDVNVTGPFLLMRAAIPHMIKGGGGSIVNISSLAGVRSIPSGSAYCTTKSALVALTQQVALDYGAHKIRCNAVCPGLSKTPMADNAYGNVDDLPESVFDNIPLHRASDPDEIASICEYLASDDSSYMTGSVLLIDGGTHVVDAFAAGLEIK